MAKDSKRDKTGKSKKQGASRKTITTSLRHRASVALSLSTDYFVDLHERVQDFILKEFSKNSNEVVLDQPLPSVIDQVQYFRNVIQDFRRQISDPNNPWGVDAAKFSLTGQKFFNDTRGQIVSRIVQYFYNVVLNAHRT
jgi:hypothetical protein